MIITTLRIWKIKGVGPLSRSITYPPTDSKAMRGRWAPHLRSGGHGPLYLFKPIFRWQLSHDSLIPANRQMKWRWGPHHLHITCRLLINVRPNWNPASYLSKASLMAVSAYKLNKQGDNMQPRLTPLAILNHSVVPAFVVSTGDKNNLLDHMGGGSCPGAVVSALAFLS